MTWDEMQKRKIEDHRLIEECAKLAECACPNDGRDHTECPFCSIAKSIRDLKFNAAPKPA